MVVVAGHRETWRGIDKILVEGEPGPDYRRVILAEREASGPKGLRFHFFLVSSIALAPVYHKVPSKAYFGQRNRSK